jgi:hypothetical protein
LTSGDFTFALSSENYITIDHALTVQLQKLNYVSPVGNIHWVHNNFEMGLSFEPLAHDHVLIFPKSVLISL